MQGGVVWGVRGKDIEAPGIQKHGWTLTSTGRIYSPPSGDSTPPDSIRTHVDPLPPLEAICEGAPPLAFRPPLSPLRGMKRSSRREETREVITRANPVEVRGRGTADRGVLQRSA